MSYYSGFSMFDALLSLFVVLFMVLFLTTLIKGIRQRHHNNQSPVLTRTVTVVSKRRHVDHHMNPVAHGYHTTSSSSYYVTFQEENGNREEFRLNGRDYGMMVEGDVGTLTSQGTRFLKFQRIFKEG